ncbi:MAG: NAD(P)-dependent glycerol-3-phosphate dehydrogenase [Ardenticatenales bacterium]|nr:NAD(P)-dependent glycerol-3-phosphate dehydrogenase [Ardenticatenales bacterium]
MSEKIAVIGSGSWGTTLAVLIAAQGREAWMWVRSQEEEEHLSARRENPRFLPGVPFPDSLHVSADAALVLRDAALVLLVAPAQKTRANVRDLRELFPPEAILLTCSKGLELGTLKRMTEVIKEELPEALRDNVGVLSGPNIAREIAAGLPASTVVAMENQQKAQRAQQFINTPTFRVYTHQDLVGVELAGALKNIIAIGAGVVDHFALGENAKSTYLTRGLAEIARLGTAGGANPLTFAGLAGLGDLLCTCASPHSRNHYVGVELAKGRSLEDIRASMTQIAEGVFTIQAAREMAQKYGVEMPVTEELYQMLFEGKSVQAAMRDLMHRDPKHELQGIALPYKEQKPGS